MNTAANSPEDRSLNALDPNQVAEQILGPGFDRLNDADYVYRLSDILRSPTEFFDNPGLEVLEFIAERVAEAEPQEKGTTRLRLQTELKNYIFHLIYEARNQIEAHIEEVEKKINKARKKKKLKRTEEGLPTDNVDDNIQAKYAKEIAAIESQKGLLATVSVVPDYLRDFIEQSAERRKEEEDIEERRKATQQAVLDSLEARREATKNGTAEPSEMLVTPINEIRTASELKDAIRKWGNVVTAEGNGPIRKRQVLFWRNMDGSINPNAIQDDAVIKEYWQFRDLLQIRPAFQKKFERDLAALALNGDGLNDEDLNQYVSTQAADFIKNFLSTFPIRGGYTGLLMKIMNVDNIVEAQSKLAEQLKMRILNERAATAAVTTPPQAAEQPVKVELVVMNVDQKLRRIAEVMADEMFDKKMAENRLESFLEIYRVDKIVKARFLQMAAEGVREKYTEEIMNRLKHDPQLRGELAGGASADESQKGFWERIKKAMEFELPKDSKVQVERLEEDLESIAERLGISWHEQREVEYLTEEERESVWENESIAQLHGELQKKLKAACDEYIQGHIDDNEFRRRIRNEVLPILQQIQEPPDATLVAYLEDTTGMNPDDISKMGLLDKLKKARANEIALDLDNIRLVMGQARNVHVSTEVRSNSLWDRMTKVAVNQVQKNRFLNKFVSPTSLAMGVYAASNAVHMVATSTVPRVAGTAVLGAGLGLLVSSSVPVVVGGLAAGCLVGGAYAYFRRNAELMRTKAQVERREALGNYEKPGLLEGVTYEKVGAASLGYNINNAPDYEEKMDAIAEAVARQEISAQGYHEKGVGKKVQRKVDLISFDPKNPLERQRLQLLRTIAEGKVALREMAAQGKISQDWEQDLAGRIDKIKDYLGNHIVAKDKKWQRVKRKDNWKSAGLGAGIALAVGGLSLGLSSATGWLTETVNLTPGHVNTEALAQNLKANGYSFGAIEDIKKHLVPDPGTGQISDKNLEYLRDTYGMKVNTSLHEGAVTTELEALGNGQPMNKEAFVKALQDANSDIKADKVFDKYGHVDRKYLDQFGLKVTETPVNVSTHPPTTLSGAGWEEVAKMNETEYLKHPDRLRFLWDGKPELGNDGQYHFSIDKMFDPKAAHGDLPASPAGMKVALEMQENGKSVWKFFDVDKDGGISLPPEYFGDKVARVPKGSFELPGLKTDSLVVGYHDNSGVFRTVAKVTGDGSYNVADHVTDNDDFMHEYGAAVEKSVKGADTVMYSAQGEQQLYGAISFIPARQMPMEEISEQNKRKLIEKQLKKEKKEIKGVIDRGQKELERRKKVFRAADKKAKKAIQKEAKAEAKRTKTDEEKLEEWEEQKTKKMSQKQQEEAAKQFEALQQAEEERKKIEAATQQAGEQLKRAEQIAQGQADKANEGLPQPSDFAKQGLPEPDSITPLPESRDSQKPQLPEGQKAPESPESKQPAEQQAPPEPPKSAELPPKTAPERSRAQKAADLLKGAGDIASIIEILSEAGGKPSKSTEPAPAGPGLPPSPFAGNLPVAGDVEPVPPTEKMLPQEATQRLLQTNNLDTQPNRKLLDDYLSEKRGDMTMPQRYGLLSSILRIVPATAKQVEAFYKNAEFENFAGKVLAKAKSLGIQTSRNREELLIVAKALYDIAHAAVTVGATRDITKIDPKVFKSVVRAVRVGMRLKGLSTAPGPTQLDAGDLTPEGRRLGAGPTVNDPASPTLLSEQESGVSEKKESSETVLEEVTDMWNQAAERSSNGVELYAQFGTIANRKGWIVTHYASQKIIELKNKQGDRVFVPGVPQGPVNIILSSWFTFRAKSGADKWSLVRPAVISPKAPENMAPTDIVGDLVKKGEFIPN